MTKQKLLNACDHGHDTEQEVRMLPMGTHVFHGNLILCYNHYKLELQYRKDRKWDKTVTNFPKWENLKKYE